MISVAMLSALFLITGWPQAEASNSWHDVYPYDTPSHPTTLTTLSQAGSNQRQSLTRKQLASALTSLLGNPAVIFSGLGIIANAAYTTQQSISLSDSINDSNKRIDDANSDISAIQKRNSVFCSALASVSPPSFVPGQTPATPTSPISQAIGSATGTSWPIIFPLSNGNAGTTITAGVGDAGLDLSIPTTALDGAASSSAALSVADFNLFRLQAIQAFDSIDNKMRELLSVISPACQ